MMDMTSTLTEALCQTLSKERYAVKLCGDHIAIQEYEDNLNVRLYIRLADDVLKSGNLIEINHAADESGVIYIRAVPAALAIHIADHDFVNTLMWRIAESYLNLRVDNFNAIYPSRVNNQPS